MKILFVITYLFSFNSWSYSGKEAWSLANTRGKVWLLTEYKAFFTKYETLNSTALGELNDSHTSFMSWFLSEAWAAAEMDCIYAGWPSRRVSNLCSSPARHNPNYQQGSCGKNQMQCQPLFFGKGLCVPTSTSQQRSLAFTNCDKKFQTSKKTPEDIVKEIRADGKEAALFDLMDFADKICKEGKQAGTGMCKRLQAAVDRMRHFKKSEIVVDTPKKEAADSVISLDPVVVVDKKTVNDSSQKKGLILSIITANRAMDQVTSEEDCEIVTEGTPFERDEPRPVNFDFVTMRSTAGGWDNTFVSDKTDGLRPTGFRFANAGPNSVAGDPINPSERVEREWRFVSEDNSRRETYLWITDDAGSGYLSQLMETMILIVPRKMKPVIEDKGNDLHVTLTTGEKVIYDKKTKIIKAGVLKEGKVDLNPNRFNRKFAPISYSGSGISIRLDKRGGDPRLISGNAVVSQNGKTCQVKASELWQEEDFRYEDDKKLVDFLNRKCGKKFTL
ncbi:MAG: hypothetical protein NDI69_12975 [Bacteriovoracaceae bacterium]|nr:hypothetical protein [Bacteriovoracaceae bacterium]